MTAAHDPTRWVEAGPFRAHLRHLVAAGPLSVEEVAVLAGITPRLARRLLHGDGGRPLRRICPEAARHLLRLRPADVRAAYRTGVPTAVGRPLALRLLRRGWSQAALAEAIGAGPAELPRLLRTADPWPLPLVLRLTALLRAGRAPESGVRRIAA